MRLARCCLAASARRPLARLSSSSSSSSSSATAAAFDLYTPSPEHAALRASVRAFAEREVEPQAQAHDRAESFNLALFRRLGSELGLLGLTADAEHGGAGMDATAVAIVHEELSAVDPALCLSYLAHSLLFVNNLNVNGSEAQKAAYLPRACSGELLGGMCMSEPGSGTDVLGMQTRAVHVPAPGAGAGAGAAGGHWALTGTKMWITNGALNDAETGDAFLVYARSGAGAGAKGRYSLFLVDKGMPGFSLGSRIKDKCGMRASNTAELVLDGVRVPAATHLVGEEGSALLCMMRNLEVER